jgi:hypothetical protein
MVFGGEALMWRRNHEDFVLMNGINDLIKETLERALTPLVM